MNRLRFLAISTVAAFLYCGVAFAIDAPPDPGIILRVEGTSADTSTRVYKLVRFASNILTGSVQTISAGEAVVYDTISDDGITIARTTISGDGSFAGIAVTSIVTNDHTTGVSAADDAGNENWGYIIIHGPVAALQMGGSNAAAVGDPFITSRDNGAITSLERTSYDASGSGLTASTAIYNNAARQSKAASAKGGFFMDAPTDNNSRVDVFVEAE